MEYRRAFGDLEVYLIHRLDVPRTEETDGSIIVWNNLEEIWKIHNS